MVENNSLLNGALHSGDDGFEDSVTTVTGVGTPSIVLRPHNTRDVVHALQVAREQHMPITVRSGGHSLAGLSQAHDGMLIDMRSMNSVERIGTTSRVIIAGGATWGHVAQVLAPEGLALTAGDTANVGVAGLTLGGCIGWMVREYGLAIDSLVGATLVTAEGQVLELSSQQHPELFWAVRGGGANFGILTQLEFEAHRVDDVVFGTIILSLDKLTDARQIVQAWHACQSHADRRLTSVLSLLPAMQENTAMAMLQFCFSGPSAQSTPYVTAFTSMGTVIQSDIAARPYASILATDDPFPAPRAAQQNSLLPAFDEQEQQAVAAAFETGQLMMSLRAMGGAVSDIDAHATAFSARDAVVMVVATQLLSNDNSGLTLMPKWDGVMHYETGSYVNWLDSADAQAARRAYSNETRERLSRIKTAIDPSNMFSRAIHLTE